MAKFRSPQIKDGAINSNHLVSGIVVNNVLLSKGNRNPGQDITFTVLNTLTLSGTDNTTYNLDALFPKSGGTITGNLVVTGSLTASGGLTVPSGALFTISNGTSTVSGADIIQALAGVASTGTTVTAANLIALTNGSDASALHTHTPKSLGFKETRAISKRATSSDDTLSTNFGDAAVFSVPSTSSLESSDLEVYLNGQLIEQGVAAGSFTWSVNGTVGTVTFNGSTSGDHLYIKWRAVSL